MNRRGVVGQIEFDLRQRRVGVGVDGHVSAVALSHHGDIVDEQNFTVVLSQRWQVSDHKNDPPCLIFIYVSFAECYFICIFIFRIRRATPKQFFRQH